MNCFIISPIGGTDSVARKLADAVFITIIEPALEQTNVSGHRADHINDVGRISEKMFDDILGADFCIALLTGSNPNVFYEVAVAHSAGIPVILLTEMDTDPPFDLKDQRTLHYTLDAVSVYRGDNVRALAERIENVRKLKGMRRVPFGDNLTPLNARSEQASGLKIEPDSMASPAYWTELVDRAKARFYISAFGLAGWKNIPGMRKSLINAGERGCEVRLMTMDPASPGFAALANPDIVVGRIDSLGDAIVEARNWYASVLQNNPRSEVRAIRKGLVHQQIIISDDRLVWSPYYFSTEPKNTPRIECGPDNPLFLAALREFEGLWEANAPATTTPKPKNGKNKVKKRAT